MEHSWSTALWRQFGAVRRARERSDGLSRVAVDPAPLARPLVAAVSAAVRGVLICHLSHACLARPLSLRRPGGGIFSSCSLRPRGPRFRRIAARTALYQGATARLSRIHAPEVPHDTGRTDRRAGAPVRPVSLVTGAAGQLSGTAALQFAPRPGTCGPDEPFSRTARHP